MIALAGHAPKAVAVYSEDDLRLSWLQYLRPYVVRKICENEGVDVAPEIAAQLQNEAGSEWDEHVETICGLVRSLRPVTDHGLRTFFKLAHRITSTVWLVAMKALDDSEPNEHWKKRLFAALKSINPKKRARSPSKKLLKRLREILSAPAS